VTQLARTVGRALGLNEDLIEATALGHDLGQPPFGAAGEAALDDLLGGRLDGRGGPGLGDLGGFWRTWQGLRVVDRLEKRYGHPGLNLTDQVREGILKCGSAIRLPAEEPEGTRGDRPQHFEGQVVALADRISSALSDLDDALQAGVIDVARVERLEAVKQLQKKLGARYRTRAGRFVKANAIHRGLIHLLVTSTLVSSQRALSCWMEQLGVRSSEDVRAARAEAVRGGEIRLSSPAERMLAGIEAFLENRVRRGYDADRVAARGRRVLLGLFTAYHADPTLLPDHVLLRFKEIARVRFLRDVPMALVEQEIAGRYRGDSRFVRLLADQIAGMTDAYAVEEHARLTEMGAVPIPSAEQLRRER